MGCRGAWGAGGSCCCWDICLGPLVMDPRIDMLSEAAGEKAEPVLLGELE